MLMVRRVGMCTQVWSVVQRLKKAIWSLRLRLRSGVTTLSSKCACQGPGSSAEWWVFGVDGWWLG